MAKSKKTKKAKARTRRFKGTWEIELVVEDPGRLLASAREIEERYPVVHVSPGTVDDEEEFGPFDDHVEALYTIFSEISNSDPFLDSGIAMESTVYGIEEITSAKPDLLALFDAASLFEVAAGPEGFVVTPRTAFLLHSALEALADQAYDECEQGGEDQWGVFAGYPPITRRQDLEWRRRAARCYDDLAEDIERGDRPIPRCVAEEVALWKAIEKAEEWLEGGDWFEDELARLPEHKQDWNFDDLREHLYQDHDFKMLNNPALDGIEDGDSPTNQALGLGDDLLPHNWFRTFLNVTERDPWRGYRR